MFKYSENNLPGTQSILKPNPGTAHEWVISSEQDSNFKLLLVGKTKAPEDLKSLKGSLDNVNSYFFSSEFKLSL